MAATNAKIKRPFIMPSQDFVHLHVHTEYSLLDGLSQINRLVDRAKALEMESLAITDHGTMFGVIDFYRACKAADIKPIIGVEAYLAKRRMQDRDREDRKPFHMLLLAKNEVGYRNLLKISSAAQLDGFYYNPRVDHDFLAAHSEGLIATSGCLGAEIPNMIMNGREDEARQKIGWYLDVFGKENFFLELQEHDIDELRMVNQWLYENREFADVQFVATNDVHYVLDEDHDPHDTLLCIQTGSLKSEPKAKRLAMSDASYHLKSQVEMWNAFGEIRNGEALKNTLKIAEMCEVNLDSKGYHLPVFPVPEGYTADTYLLYLCEKGLRWRYGDSAFQDTALVERLHYELGVIHNMGFDTYFLIVWDLCEYARHADIWWNVRGSGAGSVAAYCLGITNIDPIQNSLLFERFLNPGRVSMPDIDLDYPDDRRSEMIDYTARKYGEDKVAAIITFGTMGAKAAVRDVGRALDVPLSVVNQAAKLIPTEPKPKPIMTYVENNPELTVLYKQNPEVRNIIDTATKLQGITRHASTHAAGVIVADKPLVEYIPLHRPTNSNAEESSIKAVTQFPMETCESIGLLKVDFLGLSTLTILRKAADLIAKHHGINYTMNNIPYRHEQVEGDPAKTEMLNQTFELIGRGDTVGVFQVESGGMQQMLRGMRPKRFEHIIAAISLYRPGPMDYIPTFNKRMHGEEEVQYHHEKLKPILEETYGIMVYQEQIMQVAGQLFGYQLGEADLMRKAVSKKREKDLAEHKSIFRERGPQYGVDEEAAERIFADIEFFANYGFNKAHASDYAVITVQTAFLKTHYPEEYMAALLTVQRDDSAKVSVFLEEARRLNIPILPPDVNYSMLDFDIQQLDDGRRGIRFGMAAVKNAGVASLQYLIDRREEGGPFTSLEDLCRRADLHVVGKRTLESLIRVGALSAFGNRSQLLAGLDRLMSFSVNHHKDLAIGQMNMFGDMEDVVEQMLQNLPNIEEADMREMLGWEKELLGLYVTGRPVDKYREQLKGANTLDISVLKTEESQAQFNERDVAVAGEIVSMRKIVTRNNELMCVLSIEDWRESAGTIEAVIFPRTWRQCQTMINNEELALEEGEIVRVKGKYDASRGDPQIIVDEVTQRFEAIAADRGDLPDYQEMDLSYTDSPDIWEEPPRLDVDDAYYNEAPAQSVAVNGGGMAAPVATNGAAEDSALEPLRPLNGKDERVPQWIYVYLQPSGDVEKDRSRMTRVHTLMTTYPGNDRFSIIWEAPEQSVKLEFKLTTQICDALVNKLKNIVGENNIRVFTHDN
jgi:DNA polymerase-3 subunit alpha